MDFELCKKITDTISRVIVGKDQAIELLLVGLLAEGHVLLADEINRTIPRTQSSQRILTRIQTARRRMRNPRHWPSRMRAWFAASSMEVRVSEH